MNQVYAIRLVSREAEVASYSVMDFARTRILFRCFAFQKFFINAHNQTRILSNLGAFTENDWFKLIFAKYRYVPKNKIKLKGFLHKRDVEGS